MKRAIYPSFVAGGAAASVLLGACFPSFTFGTSAQSDGGDATVASDQSAPTADGSSDTGSISTLDGGGDVNEGADSALPDGEAGGGPLVQDAGSCAPTGLDGSVAPVGVTIATTGIATAVGLGQQVHLVTQSDCSYRYFYLSDDGTVLVSKTSTDFVSWSSADQLTLNGSVTYGDDFSVAYARIAGQDVIHAVVDVGTSTGSTGTFDLRTTVASGHLTTPSFVQLPGTSPNGACPQDGPSVVVTSDGHVVDVTGWTSHPSTSCDTDVYESTGIDDGTTFGAGYVLDGYFVSVPSYDFAHQLVELPSAGTVMVGFPDEDDFATTAFGALGAQVAPFDAGFARQSDIELFATNGTSAWYADWGLCRMSDSAVHAIRHVFADSSDGGISSAFEAEVYGGPSVGWQPENPPPSSASPANLGLAVVSARDPSHGFVVATVSGNGQTIQLAKQTSAGTWSTLPSITRSAPIQSLAGTGCGASRPAIFWTEGNASPYSIVAADLSAQLQ